MKIFSILVAGMMFFGAAIANAQMGDDTVYELRTYTTNEGKLDDLHARFRDDTIGLFNTHGMTSLGYWTPVDKPNTLIYVISHASLDQAKKNWQAFINDPDWKVVAERTNANGPILAKAPESVYMKATDYSLDMLK
jgi:hypothetical protein